jgi:hypothetical protein
MMIHTAKPAMISMKTTALPTKKSRSFMEVVGVERVGPPGTNLHIEKQRRTSCSCLFVWSG